MRPARTPITNSGIMKEEHNCGLTGNTPNSYNRWKARSWDKLGTTHLGTTAQERDDMRVVRLIEIIREELFHSWEEKRAEERIAKAYVSLLSWGPVLQKRKHASQKVLGCLLKENSGPRIQSMIEEKIWRKYARFWRILLVKSKRCVYQAYQFVVVLKHVCLCCL